MIKIEEVEVVGFRAALRGMRNPKDSWHLADSEFEPELHLGPNDEKLCNNLSIAGRPHRKFMRMINIYMDITAPLYWWKEFDTYKVGTVANSCSTMHKIQSKEFTLDMFSHEHLSEEAVTHLEDTIILLEKKRQQFLKESETHKTGCANDYWWDMIQMLPSSFNQKRTVMISYEVAANMYEYRNPHKLDEWNTLMRFFESLPHSELITHKKKEEKEN